MTMGLLSIIAVVAAFSCAVTAQDGTNFVSLLGCPQPFIFGAKYHPPKKHYFANYDNGLELTITCNNGMILYNHQEKRYMEKLVCTCIFNKWDYPVEKLICKEPPTGCDLPKVEHLVIIKPQPKYLVRDFINYKCEDGYQSSATYTKSRCMSSKKFFPVLPTCTKIVYCPRPEYEGLILDPVKSRYSVGEDVKLDCKKGYFRQGFPYANCEDTGKFHPPISSTICKKLGCKPPSKIQYGKYMYKPRKDEKGAPTQKDLYDLRDIIRYSCYEGYLLVGKTERYCQFDNTFSWKAPTCVEIMCDKPADLPHGRFILEKSKYKIKETIKYSCSKGYLLKGEEISTCTLNSNKISAEFDKRPTCEEIRCANPGGIPKGDFTPKSSSYALEAVVTYTCDDEYKLKSGNGEITCKLNLKQDAAYFTQKPTCIPVTCSAPMGTPHGDYRMKKISYNIRETVEYFCDKGYKLVEDDATATCVLQPGGQTAKFTERRTCREIMCKRPMETPNGSWKDEDGKQKFLYSIGDMVTYTCKRGYRLRTGESGERTCSLLLPIMMTAAFPSAPICEEIFCQEKMDIDNGDYNPKKPFNRYKIDDTVDYFCDKGYMPNRENTESTCDLSSNGLSATFTERIECKPILCNKPPMVANADYTIKKTTYSIGETVIYSCNRGYRLDTSTSRTSTCEQDGEKFSASFKTNTRCIRITCKHPGEPDNGGASMKPGGGDYYVDDKVTFTCDDCYNLVGKSMSTCTTSGTFDNPVPKCEIKICKDYPPIPKHGKFDKILKHDFPCGTVFTYSCDEGYILSGPKTAECLPDGSFSIKHAPKCTVITCPPPEISFDEEYLFIDNLRDYDYPYGAELVYECYPGAILIGEKLTRCEINGKFSGKQPYCKPAACGRPPLPENGVGAVRGKIITETETTFEVFTKVKYRCEKGYSFSGTRSNDCLEDGTWKYTEAPKCRGLCRSYCGDSLDKRRVCQCDPGCQKRGDCCEDYEERCGGKSCVGRCGSKGGGRTCSCDVRICRSPFADGCCDDFDYICKEEWYAPTA